MRAANAAYTLAGLVLLGFVVQQTDLAAVAEQLARAQWGMVLVLAVYLGVFVVDSVTWQLALPSVPLDGRWLWRITAVRLVGEAFNSVIPAGGMGGEPIKAMLLKRHYAVDYRDGIASIIMGRTVNMIAQVPFIAGALVPILASDLLSADFKRLIAFGLAGFAAATGAFFVVQRRRMSSRAGGWVARLRFMDAVAGLLRHVREVEERFVAFYVHHRARFVWSFVLALAQWFLGVLEIYFALRFLGQPVSLVDAWMIEAVIQLVRSVTFFMPANLGTQDGAIVLICGALTGSPALGLALALLRRAREILWIAAGLALATRYSFREAG